MTFKHGGALHRVAFNWLPSWRDEPPTKVTICRLFWLTVMALTIMWPLLVITRVIGWGVRIVGAIPALLLFGYRPAGPSWRFGPGDDGALPFEPIKRWPQVEGMHVMPAIPLIALAIVIGVCGGVWTGLGKLVGPDYRLIILGVAGAGVALLIVSQIYQKSESWMMLRAFLRSIKQRFCPIVEFK